jgi:hypothetical protein
MGLGPNTRDTRATESWTEEHILRDSRSRNKTATAGGQRVPSHLLVALAVHPKAWTTVRSVTSGASRWLQCVGRAGALKAGGAEDDAMARPPVPSGGALPVAVGYREQAGRIDAGASEAVGVRRVSLRPPQAIPAPEEDRFELDDLALHPAGHRDDLPDPTAAVELALQMHHDVDATGHRRHNEPAPDVSPDNN